MPEEKREIPWTSIGMGVGIGALGVGVGYGVYRLLAGRAGYTELEATAKRIRDEMIAKEERLAATTDPEVRRMIYEDYQQEGRALTSVVIPKLAEIAGTDPIDTFVTLLGIGVAGYVLWRAFTHYKVAKMLAEARTVKPVLQPTPNDAVMLGMMPDKLAEIGMTSADIGLTDAAIYQAQAVLGVVPPPMYGVSDALAVKLGQCAIGNMVGAGTAALGAALTTGTVGSMAASIATGATVGASVVITGAAMVTTAITIWLGAKSFGLFFLCPGDPHG